MITTNTYIYIYVSHPLLRFFFEKLNYDYCIDIAELDAGKAATVEFPNPNDLTKFNVTVTPDTGFWKGATYKFTFIIPDHYVSFLKKNNKNYDYIYHLIFIFFSL